MVANLKGVTTRAKKNKGKLFYAVVAGTKTGLFDSWDDCSASIHKFPRAKFRGFQSLEEAVEFLNMNSFTHDEIQVHTSGTSPKSENLSDYCKSKGCVVPASTALILPGAKQTLVPDQLDKVQVIYTDGACINNGKADAAAGYGIFWGTSHSNNTGQPLPIDGYTPTNNRAELYAVIMALKQACEAGLDRVVIKCDSSYVIQTITSHIHVWIKNNSLKTRKNCDLWEILLSVSEGISVHWDLVSGHAGIPGNVIADELANRGAELYGFYGNDTSAEPSNSILIAGDPQTPLAGIPQISLTEVPQTPSAGDSQSSSLPELVSCNSNTSPASNSACTSCSDPEVDEMIQCSKCEGWLHYWCTRLPSYQLHLLCNTSRKFQCELCTVVPEEFAVRSRSMKSSKQKDYPLTSHSEVRDCETQTSRYMVHNSDTEAYPLTSHPEVRACETQTSLYMLQNSDTQTPQLQVHDSVTQTPMKVYLTLGTQCNQSTEGQKQGQTTTQDQSSDLVDVLNSMNSQLQNLCNFQEAIREMESKYVEKLINVNNENSKLLRDRLSVDLEASHKEVADLKHNLKCKGLTITKLEAEIVTLKNNVRNPNCICLENEEVVHKLQAAKDRLQNENVKLHDEAHSLKLRTTQLKSEVETANSAKLGIQKTLDCVQEQLSYHASLSSKLHADLQLAHSKIMELSDEVIAWKLHQSCDSSSNFQIVSKRKAAQDKQSDNYSSISLTNKYSPLSNTSVCHPDTRDNDRVENIFARAAQPTVMDSNQHYKEGKVPLNTNLPPDNSKSQGLATDTGLVITSSGSPRRQPVNKSLYSTVVTSTRPPQTNTNTSAPTPRGNNDRTTKPVPDNQPGGIKSSAHGPKTSDNNTEKVDILVVGNSHVSQLAPRRMYKHKACKVQLLEDKSLRGAMDYISTCNVSSSVVVLQVVDNDLANHNCSADTCIIQVKDLISKCEDHFADATICVVQALQRILPSKPQTRIYNEKVARFNELLDKLSTNVISIAELDTHDCLSSDGVHLNRFGLAQMVRAYKLVLNPILGLMDYRSYDLLKSSNMAEDSRYMNMMKERRRSSSRMEHASHHDHLRYEEAHASQRIPRGQQHSYNDYYTHEYKESETKGNHGSDLDRPMPNASSYSVNQGHSHRMPNSWRKDNSRLQEGNNTEFLSNLQSMLVDYLGSI